MSAPPDTACVRTPQKCTNKINKLKNGPSLDLWGIFAGCHRDGGTDENRLGPTDKEWALATASPCRPQTFPAGSVPLPLSSPSARRIDPLWGLCPPMPPASAPPSGLAMGRAFLKKSFSSRRCAAKNSEEWRAIRLRIVRRYRNRPEGGMFATEYYARACTVESDLCPARRRRGKRALLRGLCGAVAV